MAKRKRKPKTKHDVPSAEVEPSCSSYAGCLADAEDALRVGDSASARRSLDFASSLHYQPSPRYSNALGLALLLTGDVQSAATWLDSAQAEFGPAALSAAKNAYWAAHLLPEATWAFANVNGSVHTAASNAFELFRLTQDYINPEAGAPMSDAELDAWTAESGTSIFDVVPVQRGICTHPFYDRERHRTAPRQQRRPQVEVSQGESTKWRQRYIDLLQRSLTRYLTRDLSEDVRLMRGDEASDVQESCEGGDDDGCDAPWHIGQGAGDPSGPFSQKYLSGLVHLQWLMDDVMRRGVAGDILEAGCYNGGTAVLLRALLDTEADMSMAGVLQQPRRRLLLADSFEGIPMPRTKRGQQVDTSAAWAGEYRYSTGEAQARATLRRYGFPPEDEPRIIFLTGYFNETLPLAPTKRLALVHVDADAYDSVLDTLRALYDRLEVGGHVIIDDFHLPGVRAAVQDFRQERSITDALLPVPSDHVTTCAPDWDVPELLTVQPLTVAYWTRARDSSAGGRT